MPISFQKIPVGTLNVKDGSVSGIQNKPKPLPNIGMDTNTFHQQVLEMVNNKVPIEKAYSAIDAHSDITDKPRAKSMAQAIYQIMGSK